MNQHHMMPHITVESPVTHNSWEDGKYTTYDIFVNCEDDSCPLFALSRSNVSRRYREFRWLRKRLCSVSSPMAKRVPQLPTLGCPLFDDRFSADFIENRRRGLEEFLQGVCSIPTLMSEAVLHLFVQTDLNVQEIDSYLGRKWGRHEEVQDVIVSRNRQKVTEERDEIASLASVGRWSEASILDLDDDLSSNTSATSSANNNGSTTSKNKRSQPRAVVSNKQVIVQDSEVISPVFGLYLPPDATASDDGESEPDATVPVVVRASRRQQRAAANVPVGLESGISRRSISAHIQINGNSTSPGSSLSPASYDSQLDSLPEDAPLDRYQQRHRGKSLTASKSPKSMPYYCSNAVWLSASTNGRSIGSGGGSHATSSLSPPSSSLGSSLSGGRP